MTEPKTCPTCGVALAADATGGACPKCLLQAGFATGGSAPAAAPDHAPTPEELAPKFPGLVIEQVLGRGGMGVVYKARHKALDRDVALKILPASVAGDRAFADRFQREARALAKLQHPNIVGVHDFGQTDGLFWLVMEYVDGANIRQAMKAGAIGPKEALAIVPQICDALQYAHEHGVVHRDIKPENVLLDKSGRVKVADFGLAKMMEHGESDRTLTGAGQVMGTPHYMAPEQVEHPRDVDHRADIYSLGVVFYEMLTGELPMGRFAAPSSKSDVDARIDEIVMRTLEKEREARYQQVVDVKTDMGRAASTEPSAPNGTKSWHRDSAEAKARGARLSKLAVAGALGAPATLILAVVVTAIGSAVGDGVDGGVMILLMLTLIGAAWIASMVAWVRIHRSGDKLRGRAWAAVGTFLPMFGWCLAGPVMAILSGVTVKAPPNGDRGRGQETVTAGDGFSEIDSKWKRLKSLGPKAQLVFLVALYDHKDRPGLSAMPEEERLQKAHSGMLGLPLYPADALPHPLADFHLTGVQFDENASPPLRATATATAGTSVIRFPMSRSFEGTEQDGKLSKWDFAAGQVEITGPDSAPPGERAIEIKVDPHTKPFDRSLLTQFTTAAWKRICAMHGTLAIEDASEFYRHEDFLLLTAMRKDELKRMEAEGKTGLPLADIRTLGAALVGFHIEWIEVHESGTDATVTARVGAGHRIQFPIVFQDGRWWFAIGPVQML